MMTVHETLYDCQHAVVCMQFWTQRVVMRRDATAASHLSHTNSASDTHHQHI